MILCKNIISIRAASKVLKIRVSNFDKKKYGVFSTKFNQSNYAQLSDFGLSNLPNLQKTENIWQLLMTKLETLLKLMMV